MNPQNSSLPGQGAPSRGPGLPGLLGRILATLISLALLVVGFMFSVVFIGIALVVGAVFFGWVWWKVRRAARLARSDPRFQDFAAAMNRGAPPPGGDVIEGEVIRGEWQDKEGPRR
jgi:Flp pilus assembly protein TadB